MTEKEINKAAKEHAKGVLGEEQYLTNKEAVRAIMGDFKAGIEWAQKQEKDGK